MDNRDNNEWDSLQEYLDRIPPPQPWSGQRSSTNWIVTPSASASSPRTLVLSHEPLIPAEGAAYLAYWFTLEVQ